MKLLKIEEGCGVFLDSKGEYVQIDRITKDEILRLVGVILDEEGVEIDAYDEAILKNLAHQVIYKSIAQKFTDLRSRRAGFADESARLYLEDYDRYRAATQQVSDAG